MKKILFIGIFIMGIVFITGCIGEKTDVTGLGGLNSGSGNSETFGETRISDNTSVSGMRAENFYESAKGADLSQGEYSWMKAETTYVDDLSGGFDIVLEIGKNTLDNLVLQSRGTIVKNFKVTEESGYMNIKAEIVPSNKFSGVFYHADVFKMLPIVPKNGLYRGPERKNVYTQKTNEISIASIPKKTWNEGKILIIQLSINSHV